MKKSLLRMWSLLLMSMVCLGLSAQTTTFIFEFDGSVKTNTENFFTVVGSASKSGYPSVYNGVTYTKPFKVESSSSISFTTTATSTITIVQGAYNINKYGLAFGPADNMEDLTNGNLVTTTAKEYVLTDVQPGSYKIARDSSNKEVCLCYVKVEYTGSIMTRLEEPTITADGAGLVTITNPDATNSEVRYTIDNSTPTAESTLYEDSFNVADGTTVKAIAFSTNTEEYVDSPVASLFVLVDGITVATPVIKQQNGSVAITCTTPGATIEYSLDGENYVAYTGSFTLSETATVSARGVRAGSTTSDVAAAEVIVFPPLEGATEILVGYGSFDSKTIDGYSALVGKEGDAAVGYSLILLNSSKSWGSGNKKILISEGVERTAIKGSNGAQNKLVAPDGKLIKRVTFYSFINQAKEEVDIYWKEVNGVNYNGDVPMCSWNDASNPDVRVYDFGEGVSEFTFNNAGRQVCFVMKLEVVDAPTFVVPETLYLMGNEPLALEKAETIEGIVFTGSNITIPTPELDEYASVWFNTTGVAGYEFGPADVESKMLTSGVPAGIATSNLTWDIKPGKYDVKVQWFEEGQYVTFTEVSTEAEMITIYFDNSTAGWQRPYVYCFTTLDPILVPMEVVATKKSVKAYAESSENIIWDYNVYRASIPSECMFMFLDMADESRETYSTMYDTPVANMVYGLGAPVGTYDEAVTGVESIEAENAVEAVYYNLQGVRVAAPEAGNIYIEVRGSKVSKVRK